MRKRKHCTVYWRPVRWQPAQPPNNIHHSQRILPVRECCRVLPLTQQRYVNVPQQHRSLLTPATRRLMFFPPTPERLRPPRSIVHT
jgi:hypothetical protein